LTPRTCVLKASTQSVYLHVAVAVKVHVHDHDHDHDQVNVDDRSRRDATSDWLSPGTSDL
jgi:hypothetical protein